MRSTLHFTLFVVSAAIAWAGLRALMGPGLAPPFLGWPLALLLGLGVLVVILLREHLSPTNAVGMALTLAACVSFLYRSIANGPGSEGGWIDLAENLVALSGVAIMGIGHVSRSRILGRTDARVDRP
ncbi:MAG: hypothetical protein R2909_00435 [Gemmatimonadales bacterium]